jgi:hypothetical protein
LILDFVVDCFCMTLKVELHANQIGARAWPALSADRLTAPTDVRCQAGIVRGHLLPLSPAAQRAGVDRGYCATGWTPDVARRSWSVGSGCTLFRHQRLESRSPSRTLAWPPFSAAAYPPVP